MRILFMGTPDFAVASLRRLVADGHEVCGVFTQPDKPKNRGHKLVPTPVKEFALTENIPVYQPLKMRDGTALELVQSLAPPAASCRRTFWRRPDTALSTSTRLCCPSIGGRPPSTGPS